MKIPTEGFRELIKQSVERGLDIPDHMKEILDNPLKQVRKYWTHFKMREIIQGYANQSGEPMTIQFFKTHYAKCMSQVTLQRKVELFIRGGFPHHQRHIRGGGGLQMGTPLAKKRIRFVKEVLDMVSLPDCLVVVRARALTVSDH